MKKDIAIRVDNVTKDFHLPRHKSDSLKQTITQAFKPKEKGVDVHHALKGISFEVKKGEFFGVLGRNGSGKSTLLKIISEIYKPTSGTVEHNGTLVSFIELGVGFKAELTGRENVYLNGALLGFSKKEIDERYDEIVGFAELEDFMEQKLKNYSSGMKVRLAFAVAIQAKSDILILDEVLAVGDAAFQKKCYEYFKSLKEDKSKTIVFVTHGMGAVREYCDRAILIEGGRIVHEGDASVVADEYLSIFSDKPKSNNAENVVTNQKISDVEYLGMSISQNGNKVDRIGFKEDFSLEVNLKSESEYRDIVFGLYFYDTSGRSVVVVSSKAYGTMNLKNGKSTIRFDIENVLASGKYHVNFAIEDRETKRLLVQQHKVSPFRVAEPDKDGYSRHSLVYPDVTVTYE